MSFEWINDIFSNPVATTIVAPIVVTIITNALLTKYHNKNYLRNHANEIDQSLLDQAPSIRKETYEQFQQRKEAISYWAEMNILNSEEYPAHRANEFRFLPWPSSNSQDILKRSRQWTAISILNKSNVGLQITFVSTNEHSKVPISNSVGNLIDPQSTVTYLFPFRDSPLEIHAKFKTKNLLYSIPVTSDYCIPEFSKRQPY